MADLLNSIMGFAKARPAKRKEGWTQRDDGSWVHENVNVGVPGKGLTLPGTDHVGPGNDIIIGPARNMPDQIAKDHDMQYDRMLSRAKQEGVDEKEWRDMISKADQHTINQFKLDMQRDGTWQSYLGHYGLRAKAAVENLYGGVIYPKKPSPTDKPLQPELAAKRRKIDDNQNFYGLSAKGAPLNKGQYRYKLHTAAGNKFRNDPDKDKKIAAYLRGEQDKLRARMGDELYEKEWGDYAYKAEKSVSSTNESGQDAKPDDTADPLPDSDTETEEEIDNPPEEKTAPEEPAKTPEKEGEPEKEPEKEPENKELPIDEDVEMAPSTSKKDTSMDVDDASANTAGTSGKGGGGSTTPQVLQFYKARGLNYSNGVLTYNNSFRLRHWGTRNYVHAPADKVIRVTTPMVDLPVDQAAFYAPFEVYDILPMGTQIEAVSVKVTPIGQMVSFNTNASTTSSGATSHTLYGMAAVGLNTKIPCTRSTITRDTSNPMTLTAAADFESMDEWILRLWGKYPFPIAAGATSSYPTLDCATNHEIIVGNTYTTIHQPLPANSKLTSGNSVQVIHHSNQGQWRLNEMITKFPMQPHTGTPIINYNFSFKEPVFYKPRQIFDYSLDGYANVLAGSVAPIARLEHLAGSTYVNQRHREGTFYEIKAKEGQRLINEERGNTRNTYAFSKETRIDEWKKFNFTSVSGFLDYKKESEYYTMPNVCFGIEAVQANVPETTVQTYINASSDVYVETEIRFRINLDSHFNWGAYEDGQTDTVPQTVPAFMLHGNRVPPTHIGRLEDRDEEPLTIKELNKPAKRGLRARKSGPGSLKKIISKKPL